jgi:cadmium resistance protein CadD (predicted permease)
VKKGLLFFFSALAGLFAGTASPICKLYIPLFTESNPIDPIVAIIVAVLLGLIPVALSWRIAQGALIPLAGFLYGTFILSFALFPLTFWICGGSSGSSLH